MYKRQDEAWLAYTGDEEDSIHLHTYFDIPEGWAAPDLAARWAQIRGLRSEVMTALETARNEGTIGGGLSADIKITAPQQTADLLDGIDLASLFITSSAALEVGDQTDIQVAVRRADGGKCARCWKIVSELPADNDAAICARCVTVLADTVKG